MSWLDDATDMIGVTDTDGYNNPASAGQAYLDKIPGYVDQYMQPYINMGQTAGGIAQEQYAKMASDPTGYYNDIYATYEPSDYYAYQSDQLAKTQGNTAAAGGFSGTYNDQNAQMETQNALMNQDWDKYLNQVLGIQGGGLEGEQKMYQTGFGASSEALKGLTGYANSSAGLGYKSTQNQNAYDAQQQQQQNSMINSAMGALF